MDGTLACCTLVLRARASSRRRSVGAPREVGHFIPEPAAGKVAPQSNDVDVDPKNLGLIYPSATATLGLDILEFTHWP